MVLGKIEYEGKKFFGLIFKKDSIYLPLILLFITIVIGWFSVSDNLVGLFIKKIDFLVAQNISVIQNITTAWASFIFSAFFHPLFLIVVSGCLLAVFYDKHLARRTLLMAIVSGFIAGVASFLLKYFFIRSRPEVIFDIFREWTFSYPSFHSAVSFAILGVIGLVAIQKKRRLILIICVLSILLVGLSRLLLGVHFFSDIVGGYLIGLSSVLLVSKNKKFESYVD